MNEFLQTVDGANLLAAYKRATNIVSIEEKKDKKTYDGDVDSDLLSQQEEINLHDYLGESTSGADFLFDHDEYVGVMKEMAHLRAPVDTFFDNVTVNCEDKKVRANRLRLLSQFRKTLGEIADFSKIEG